MHCHMTHHTMMQMGHAFPNMVGVDTKTLDRRMSRVMPDYMTMGTNGMGGMFTVLKVREHPNDADPNGWYDNPKGSVAAMADSTRAKRDGIDLDRGT